MAFPEAPRTRYQVSPLDEVVCKFKFPPILRIESELPAVFQERVRGDFPRYATEEFPQAANLPPDLARLMGRGGIRGPQSEHVFTSSDDSWQLRLGRSTLSLSSYEYGQWELFRQRLTVPHQALLDEYKPAEFNHTCLRYRNVIRRSRLPFEPDVPWAELLQPWVCGFLGAPGLHGEVAMARMSAATRLPLPDSWLDVEYGLVQEEGPDGETSFMIDAHLFTQTTIGPAHAFPNLDALHHQAFIFFRWCITDRLHDALGPRPLALENG